MVDIKELIDKEIKELQETKKIDIAVKNAEINGFYAGAERALRVILNKIIVEENAENETKAEETPSKKNSK